MYIIPPPIDMRSLPAYRRHNPHKLASNDKLLTLRIRKNTPRDSPFLIKSKCTSFVLLRVKKLTLTTPDILEVEVTNEGRKICLAYRTTGNNFLLSGIPRHRLQEAKNDYAKMNQ